MPLIGNKQKVLYIWLFKIVLLSDYYLIKNYVR